MFKTQKGDISLSGYLMGFRKTHVNKKNKKTVQLFLEHKSAFRVIVQDAKGKTIFNDGFRYIEAARNRFDEMVLVIA